jgi:thiamine-monophosphate kinase
VVSSLACLNAKEFHNQLDSASQLALTLSGGDDYELVFTAAPDQREAVAAASQTAQTRVTRIGHITATPHLVLRDANGQVMPNTFSSFDHFKSA